MLLAQYLADCGVTGITSNAIYFKPNIPGDKLSNAINAYGGRVGKSEVLILIDDTFWGSAKEGVLITDDALLFKVAGHGTGHRELSVLRSAASNKGSISLNGEAVVKLTKAGENELRYVFATLDDFVANRARINDITDTDVTGIELDVAALAEICSTYTTPVCFTAEELQAQGTHPSFLDRKPVRRPSYYVMDDIPPQMAHMARFSLGIPVQDALVALSDLTINGGNASAAFVVTQRGLYSRDGKGKDTTFVPWDKLSQRSVVAELTIGRHCAVRLDDDTVLTVSNLNAIVKPYGVALIQDLIRLAATGEHAPQEAPSPSAKPGETCASEQVQASSPAESRLAMAVVEAVQAETGGGVDDARRSNGVQEKLQALVLPIVRQNEGWLVSLIKEKTGELSIAALRSDDLVVIVATALYGRLPGIVRAAIKEPAFIEFILQNRNKLIAQVVQGGELASAAAPTSEVAAGARKRLSDIKSPASGRSAPGVGRFVSEHFPMLKAEQTNAVREFDRLAQAATPRDRRSEEFQEAELKRHMFALVAGLTGLALTFPRKLAERDAQWSGPNQVVMLCDRAIAEVMIYCFASGSDLLRKEAELDAEDAAEFIAELTSLTFHGYFIQEANLRERRILRNPNPDRRQLEQIGNSDAMQRFRDSMRKLNANKYNEDNESLLGNFIHNLSFSLEELFDTPADHLAHYRLLRQSEHHIQAVLVDMDVEIETLLVEFLEQTQ